MATSVTMPALGESVSEGTVTRWLKQEGDQISADEPLLEVSTDKVDTEIPSPASGVLQKILVGEDETVDVGAELAIIGDGDGSDSGDSGAEQAEPEAPEKAQEPAPEQEQEEEEEEPAQQESAAPQAPAPQSGGGGSGGSGGGTPVTMPALGESVSEGTVTRWLKQEGDQISADEPLLEVSTDKVDTEIPSPASGVLQKILVGEDETVDVGAELAIIGDGSDSGDSGAKAEQAEPEAQETAQEKEPEKVPEKAQEQSAPPKAEPPAQQQAAPATQQQAAPAPQQAADGAGAATAYVTPLVRKLATEHGIDLADLTGTGVGGRIRKQDVLEAAERQKAPAAPPAAAAPAAAAATSAAAASTSAAPKATPSPLRGTTEKMSRLRKVIAQRMVESLQTSAQLTTVAEVDLTRIARLRTRAKADFQAREGVKLSYLPFLAKAAVEALKVHPTVNCTINTEKGEITYFDVENLGIAVDTPRGLLVPVVKVAGDLNIGGLARKIADVADRTRNNKIGPDELSGGTFTITNTGSRGALFDTPIINQPQVAILGTGAVVKRPVVIDDPNLGETIAIRSMCFLALSYDHRIVDGADAARFLMTMKVRLEEGAFEADLGL
jgi:pyruvate dehydrogenase E2 component (dihydrolipoamide acetyltransferase)